MSRGQETQAFNTASGQNTGYNANAQASYNSAQGDITDYQNQLSQFAAANPYGEGGAYQTDVNKSTAGTAAGAGASAGQALQSAAVRTGENAGGAIAGTEAMQEQNTRDLSATQAAANAQRLGAGAAYGDKVLSASAVPAQLEAGLTGTEAAASNNALSDEQKAGETPSFFDTLGSSFAGALGSTIGSKLGKFGGN